MKMYSGWMPYVNGMVAAETAEMVRNSAAGTPFEFEIIVAEAAYVKMCSAWTTSYVVTRISH
jgi:hypothetical protein